MAGAQLAGKVLAAGKREHASGCKHACVTHQHCPVMQGRIMEKDIFNQLRRWGGIDLCPGLHNLPQFFLPLANDKRAGFCLAHGCTGRDDCGNHGLDITLYLFVPDEQLGKAAFAELFQHSPDFRLKDDENADQPIAHYLFKHPANRIQIKEIGNCHCQEQDKYPLCQPERDGIPQQLHTAVNEIRHKGNIDIVADASHSEKGDKGRP